MEKTEIHDVVNKFYLTMRQIIVNELKSADIDTWNATVPAETVDDCTRLIEKMCRHRHISQEDVKRLANFYYAAHAKGIKQGSLVTEAA